MTGGLWSADPIHPSSGIPRDTPQTRASLDRLLKEARRPYLKGQKHDELYLSTRNLADCDFVRSAEFYRATHAAELGFCDVRGVT